MKSKEDIGKQIEDAKNQLVGADGEKNISYLQGFIQSLTWAIAEEEEKPKEETKD